VEKELKEKEEGQLEDISDKENLVALQVRVMIILCFKSYNKNAKR
jgi:hypothetical protein